MNYTHRAWAKSACILLAASGILAWSTTARAAVLAHTGNVASDPAGTGAVDVTFLKGTTSPGQDYLGAYEIFNSNSSHVILNDFGVTSPSAAVDRVVEGVVNSSGVAWNGYVLQMVGADFSGLGSGLVTPDTNSVVAGGTYGDAFVHMFPLIGSYGVALSGITRTNTDATLTIFFDAPVLPGDAFQLGFDMFGSGISFDPGAATYQAAIIQVPLAVPEPGTCLLLGIGTLLLQRRRKASH